MRFKFLQNAVAQAKKVIGEFLTAGGVAVDATAGNGHDTLFLAKTVGPNGKVYAFDVQAEAIKNTEKRLEEAGMAKQVELIFAGHEKMTEFINTEVDVVMFNLGYLPGADHQVMTTAENTLVAIEKALGVLKPGGLVSLVVYPGHDGGRLEALQVDNYVKSLDSCQFTVMRSSFFNRDEKAPYMILIEKSNQVAG